MSPTRRSVISNRRGKRIIEFHKFHGHRLKLEYPGKLLLREMIKSAAKRFNAMRSRRERKRKRTVAPFQKILQKLGKNQADRSRKRERDRPPKTYQNVDGYLCRRPGQSHHGHHVHGGGGAREQDAEGEPEGKRCEEKVEHEQQPAEAVPRRDLGRLEEQLSE